MTADCVDCFSVATYDMSCPRCVARWLMIQPPTFNRTEFGREIEEKKGKAFAAAVKAAWKELRDAGQKDGALHG